jgi:hypothetical protein
VFRPPRVGAQRSSMGDFLTTTGLPGSYLKLLLLLCLFGYDSDCPVGGILGLFHFQLVRFRRTFPPTPVGSNVVRVYGASGAASTRLRAP